MDKPTPRESDFGPHNAAFVEVLVKEVPQLADAYREHIKDNFGELLPHVFMGDVTRWVVAVSQNKTAPEALAAVLMRMDAVLSDPAHPCQELIWVSFIENLGGEADTLNAIRPVAGRSLVAALDKCW